MVALKDLIVRRDSSSSKTSNSTSNDSNSRGKTTVTTATATSTVNQRSSLIVGERLIFYQFECIVNENGTIRPLGFTDSFGGQDTSIDMSDWGKVARRLTKTEKAPSCSQVWLNDPQSRLVQYLRLKYFSLVSWARDCLTFCNSALYKEVDNNGWQKAAWSGDYEANIYPKDDKSISLRQIIANHDSLNATASGSNSISNVVTNVNNPTGVTSSYVMKPSFNHQYFTSALPLNMATPVIYPWPFYPPPFIPFQASFPYHPYNMVPYIQQQQQMQMQMQQMALMQQQIRKQQPIITNNGNHKLFNWEPDAKTFGQTVQYGCKITPVLSNYRNGIVGLYDLSESFLENMANTTSFHLVQRESFPQANLMLQESMTVPFEVAACCSRVDPFKDLIFCSNCAECFHLGCLYDSTSCDNNNDSSSSSKRQSQLSKAKSMLELLLPHSKNSQSMFYFLNNTFFKLYLLVEMKNPNHPLATQWKCPSCLVCVKCLKAKPEPSLLVCDHCDRGFHAECLAEPLSSIPEGQWLCDDCVECKGCGSKSAFGCGLSGR